MNNDITAAMVLWNEAPRIERLIERLRPYVAEIVVGVQESTDGTLELARKLADRVVEDKHHGFGDATFGPKVLPLVRTKWTLKVDGDELPTIELLESLNRAKDEAEDAGKNGVWLRFRSWTEGVEWDVDHAHLRLFHTSLGWPATLHSRPQTENVLHWKIGWFEHRRSTDEMVRDYLNYYKAGRGHSSWEGHNREMLHDACVGAANHKGWRWVKAHDWWPEVQTIAFAGKDPMPTMVFCGGPSRSGTRMLYDMVGKLGLPAVHAALPGHNPNPNPPPVFDVANPVWWTPEELEQEYGAGHDIVWVIITRDPKFSGPSAVRWSFVPSLDEYPAFHARAMETLDSIEGAYRIVYEDFILDPQAEFDKLADWLGRPHADVGTIYDGNAKYSQSTKPRATRRQKKERK